MLNNHNSNVQIVTARPNPLCSSSFLGRTGDTPTVAQLKIEKVNTKENGLALPGEPIFRSTFPIP